MIGLVAELLLEPRQLGQRLLELAVLEGDRRLVGQRLEQPQVVLGEGRPLGQPVRDGDRADELGLGEQRADHRVSNGQARERALTGAALKNGAADRDPGVDRVVGRPLDRHHRRGLAVVARGRPERVAALAAGVEDHLRQLGPEHRPRVVEEGDERRVELRRVLEDPLDW